VVVNERQVLASQRAGWRTSCPRAALRLTYTSRLSDRVLHLPTLSSICKVLP